MPCKEIIAVYCENRPKYINSSCGQYAKLLNGKVGGTYSYHCAERVKEFIIL
jgi:hypothetical protein